MEQPLVSIIVPIYNAKNHIVRCVESIRRQTYQNLEILLINDGSKDVSLSVCQMYANVDKRILLVDKQNSGVSATRNLGLRLAGGKYLQFVDSDDTLEPDATRLMVEKAEAHQADLVIAYYNRVNPPPEKPSRLKDAVAFLTSIVERGELPSLEELEALPPAGERVNTFGFLPEGFLDKEQFARGLMQEPAAFYFGVMWNKLYRADLVRQHDLCYSEEMNWSEDLLFNLSYIRYAERFYSLTTPVYNYVQNPTSLCHTQVTPIKVLKVKMNLFLYYKKLYQDLGLYEDNKLLIHKYLVAGAEGVLPMPLKWRQKEQESFVRRWQQTTAKKPKRLRLRSKDAAKQPHPTPKEPS